MRKREPACLHPAHPRIFVCVCLCVREYVQADEKRAANLQHAPARREEQILKKILSIVPVYGTKVLYIMPVYGTKVVYIVPC